MSIAEKLQSIKGKIISKLSKTIAEDNNISGYFITELLIENGSRSVEIVKGEYNRKQGFLSIDEAFELTNKNHILKIEKPGVIGKGSKDYTGMLADAYSGIYPLSIIDKGINTYFEKSQSDLPKRVDIGPLENTLAKYPLNQKKIGVMFGEPPNATIVPARDVRPLLNEFYY